MECGHVILTTQSVGDGYKYVIINNGVPNIQELMRARIKSRALNGKQCRYMIQKGYFWQTRGIHSDRLGTKTVIYEMHVGTFRGWV